MSKVWLSYERLSVARSANELIGAIDQHGVNVRAIQERGAQVESYRDAGGHKSGRSEKHRPDWLRVLDRLTDPDVAGIVATFQDRLSRDVEDTARLIKTCERLDKHLILPLDGVDTTRSGWTPDVKLMLHIKASVAQHYADDVAKKLKRRVTHYMEDKGIPWGPIAFGMQRVGKGYETRVVPDERHAATVLQVLTWYASDLSYDIVAQRANNTGLKFRTRRGAPKAFGRESVRTIVGNVPFYLGFLMPAGWDAKAERIRLAPGGSYLDRYLEASGARRVTTIEPLIDRELAESVIERRARNSLTGRSPDMKIFTLAGVLYDTAGRKLRSESKESGNWYRVRRGAGVWLKAEQIELEVVQKLNGLQFPAEAYDVIRRHLESRNGDEGRMRAEAALANASARKARLVDLLLDEKIERRIYDAKYAEIEADEAAARAVLSRDTDVERKLRAIGDLGSMIGMMSAGVQKRNIARLFDRINVDEEGIIRFVRLSGWAQEAFGVFAEATGGHRLGANSAESGNRGQKRLLNPALEWWINRAFVDAKPATEPKL